MLGKRVAALAASVGLLASVAPGARSDAPDEVEVVVETRAGAELRGDLYVPTSGDDHPVVVLVHGGSWRSGSRDHWSTVGPRLARSGMLALAVDYRLAGDVAGPAMPRQIEDLAAALRWVEDEAATYGGDPTRVALVGSSAGGHLSLMTAALAGNVDAVVAWSPPTALGPLATTRLKDDLRNALGCAVYECGGLYRANSPALAIDRGFPPTLIVGSSDELVPIDQFLGLTRSLERSGVDHVLELVSGSRHGQELRDIAMDDSIAFLRTHLR